MSRLILLSVVAALLLLAQPVSSQDDVPITDLGSLANEGSPSDINNQGQVVGWYIPPNSYLASQFRWTPENGWVDLSMHGLPYIYTNDLGQVAANERISQGLQTVLWEGGNTTELGDLGTAYTLPHDINEMGHVAGISSTEEGKRHAFFWTPESGMQDLGTLGGDWSSPRALNDLGWVVGASLTANGEDQAFLWTPTGGMIGLGTLGGTSSGACDINSLGQVVGSSATSGGEDHAFLWTAEGGMQDLGTLGGVWSSARAINDLGWVVGSSYTSDIAEQNETHAFIWVPEYGMMDLGTLGGSYSEARDINNWGQVVGRSLNTAGEYHAVLWTGEDGMVDLVTLGGSQSNAVEINEHGQVVGTSDTASGELHAVVWTSEPPSEPQIPVLPPDPDISDLISEVAELADNGVLKKGQANALLQKLENAARMVDEGKTHAACGQLQAFVNQVDALMRAGQLPQTIGAGLIDTANYVIGQFCG